jgi:hypothetical protein
MATTWTPFNSALVAALNQRYRFTTPPAQYQLVLTNGDWGADATYSAVMATQIATTNGYTGPIDIEATTPAAHFPSLNLASLTFDPQEVAATGGDIAYSRAVVITDLETLEFWADFGPSLITPGVPATFTVTINQGTAAADVNQVP